MHNLGFYSQVRECQRMGGGKHYEIQTESAPLLIDLGEISTAQRIDTCFEHDTWDEALKVRMKNGEMLFLSIGLDQLAELTAAQYVIESDD
jgi:hypothetical protein